MFPLNLLVQGYRTEPPLAEGVTTDVTARYCGWTRPNGALASKKEVFFVENLETCKDKFNWQVLKLTSF